MRSALTVVTMLLVLTVATPCDAQKRKTTTKTTTTTKKKNTSKKKVSTKKKGTTVSTKGINNLKNQSAQIKRNIKEQEQRLRSNERDVKQRLQNLMVINSEIEGKRRTIDTIRNDINTINGNIGQLNNQLKRLQAELDDRKAKYVKSMRYMHRNSSIQNQLMFVFSAKNFSQMYRRLRFMREYANYQRAQGEMVKAKQAEITQKHTELMSAKHQKNTLLYKGEKERRNLEGKQAEQQTVVDGLKKQQKTIQSIIAQQRKKDEAINAEIDRLVAIEVERARQRAIAEAKRRAAAEAAVRKRAEQEAARKAEEARRAAERKAVSAKNESRSDRTTKKRSTHPVVADTKPSPTPKKRETATFTLASEDQRISGSFASNRGRLPMPISGGYRIVSHYGQYNVEGLNNVRLDNKGINILGQPGASVRSIYDGEVSAVFSTGGGTWGVIVRHGNYLSVYCNLASVSVSKGQRVSTRQTLGSVGHDNILQFQLRKEKAKLNPEAWLGR